MASRKSRAPSPTSSQCVWKTPVGAHAPVIDLLDRSTGQAPHLIVSHHEDELRRVEHGVRQRQEAEGLSGQLRRLPKGEREYGASAADRDAAAARADAATAQDIVDVAAHVLLSPAGTHQGKTYTLTTPESFTIAEFASALGAALGRPVNYVDVPISAARESMVEMGMEPPTHRAATREPAGARAPILETQASRHSRWDPAPTGGSGLLARQLQLLSQRPRSGIVGGALTSRRSDRHERRAAAHDA